MLQSNKVYRNIDLRDKFFGFEMIDIIFVVLTFYIASIFSDHIIFNLTITIAIAAIIRLFKMNKPKGYLNDVVKYYTKKRNWSNNAG